MDKPLPPHADLVAGDAFRDSLLPRADVKEPFPLWHGWAIMDAFLAGAEYARSKPQPEVAARWVPVTEALPQNTDPVLAVDANFAHCRWAQYSPEMGVWLLGHDDAVRKERVTHWMRLPEIPLPQNDTERKS